MELKCGTHAHLRIYKQLKIFKSLHLLDLLYEMEP